MNNKKPGCIANKLSRSAEFSKVFLYAVAVGQSNKPYFTSMDLEGCFLMVRDQVWKYLSVLSNAKLIKKKQNGRTIHYYPCSTIQNNLLIKLAKERVRAS